MEVQIFLKYNLNLEANMSKIDWFSGSIDVALKEYQEMKGVLLVYIYHKEGKS